MSEIKEKARDYLVLVNADNSLPQGFEDTFELIWVENAVGDRFKVEKKTYEAFCALYDDVLKNDGIQIVLLNSYRTIEKQAEIYERNLKAYGLEHTKKYVATPGCSEHNTGLAIDVGIMLNGKCYRKTEDLFTIDHLFKIFQKKLPRYGLILRYPEGKESITKIGYEPWHYRYLDSVEIAQEITDKGICYEEYCQNI